MRTSDFTHRCNMPCQKRQKEPGSYPYDSCTAKCDRRCLSALIGDINGWYIYCRFLKGKFVAEKDGDKVEDSDLLELVKKIVPAEGLRFED